ncbi:MAG: phage portal protein [Pelagibacteraceae bacterium]
MAWYNFWQNKLNPAQEEIVVSLEGAGPIGSRELPRNYTSYYEYLEVVNRGINMIVDDTAEIPLRVGEQIKGLTPVQKGMRRTRLDLLLNKEPNPFQDISSFKRNLIIDYLLDGNIFIYFDGASLYHLPANYTDIEPDTKTYVAGYTFQKSIKYSPDEIIHIKENSFHSIYRGTSRLRAARRTMAQLARMREFQDNFFQNGAVPGLVIKSPSVISERNKERMIQSWMTRYRPDGGGRRPMVLDGGMELDSISNVNFKELDFEMSIASAETEILKVLGIPPIMLDSGNNANIRPNMRLYYLETILPIIRKVNFAIERFFGFEVTEDVSNIPALQPELRDAAAYYTTLVNTGIITPNEARESLSYTIMPGHDDIRVPANIAGSAVDATQGGRPPEGDTNAET